MFSLAGDGDTTEQNEPLLSESQDESLTLLGQTDGVMTFDDKSASVINVNREDLDESITPLLGAGDERSRGEVMNFLFRVPFD